MRDGRRSRATFVGFEFADRGGVGVHGDLRFLERLEHRLFVFREGRVGEARMAPAAARGGL